MYSLKFEPKNYTTLKNIYRLTTADHLLLSDVKNKTFNEVQFFNHLNKCCDLDFIMRIANTSEYFEKLFKRREYNSLWDLQYSLFGFQVSFSEKKQTNFLVHKNVQSFDLLKGAYLFHKSQLARNEVNQDFLYSEIVLLQEAIKFKSVHAIQRYNSYLYQQIERLSSKKTQDFDSINEEQESLLKEAILNCKKLLELYGSYAYMMLAEAYFYYAQWAKEKSNESVSNAIDAAIIACNFAEKYLEKSQYSIHNASLGRGLETSNSFKINTPSDARQKIMDWWSEQKGSTYSFR